MELFQQYLPISSGTTEHMCINADDPLCYCGNHGCLETYCSANALEHTSGLPIKDFFVQLREIITTGLAGGLLTPYKGLLPALESKDSSNGSPAATSFTY